MKDLVVIGGGPVGLAASLYAAHLGLDVTVLDPRLRPQTTGSAAIGASGAIDKACGEGIMPGGLHDLARLGVDPVGVPFKGIRYVGSGRSVDAAFRDGPGRGVRRTTLHHALLEAAVAAGVEVAPLTATLRTQTAQCLRITTEAARGRRGPALGARYVIAADGLHSPTRRALGLERTARPRGRSRHGLRRHSGIRPWTDHVEVHWSEVGEAYVTPVAADTVGVAVLTERTAPFEELIRSFPALGERLDGAPATSRVMGAGPFRQRTLRRVAGRVLLAGDASGYVDALTGEGIALGLAQARAAVRAIAADEPAAYERDWRRVTWRSATMTRLLVEATRARAGRRLIVPAAARIPALFRWSVDGLARPR